MLRLWPIARRNLSPLVLLASWMTNYTHLGNPVAGQDALFFFFIFIFLCPVLEPSLQYNMGATEG